MWTGEDEIRCILDVSKEIMVRKQTLTIYSKHPQKWNSYLTIALYTIKKGSEFTCNIFDFSANMS